MSEKCPNCGRDNNDSHCFHGNYGQFLPSDETLFAGTLLAVVVTCIITFASMM